MAVSATRPSRRAVVRGAAWSVPVVSIAAVSPAFAASTCTAPRTFTLDWGTTPYSHPTTAPNGSVATIASTAGTPATTIYVHFSTAFFGSGAGDGTLASGEARNLSVPSNVAGTDANRDPAITSLGGLSAGERGVRLQQVSPTGFANRQELTVSFRSGAASNSSLVNVQALAFSIVDIDNLGSPAYADRVALTSTVSFTQARDGNILGTGTPGTTGDPWLNSAAGNQNENAAGARVRVTFPDENQGRISGFTLYYWTAAGATAPATGQYHRIYLSDLQFKLCP